jgi:hypothetical protein
MATLPTEPTVVLKQHMIPGRGIAGWRGNVRILDPDTEGIPLVADVAPEIQAADLLDRVQRTQGRRSARPTVV